jgi:GNAT superfamily N-acetyltransferase
VIRDDVNSSKRRIVFLAGPFSAWEFGAEDVPPLQLLFEANPEYFFAVSGRAPVPDEAQREFEDDPPPGMAFTKRWTIGFGDASGALVGMAGVCSDLMCPHVWHIGMFLVANALHGTGVAQELYRHLEQWMRENGAHWIRLGVVQGRARAERFWQKAGYLPMRARGPVEMGARSNMLTVLMKPLTGGSPAEYLSLVVRDRPGEP